MELYTLFYRDSSLSGLINYFFLKWVEIFDTSPSLTGLISPVLFGKHKEKQDILFNKKNVSGFNERGCNGVTTLVLRSCDTEKVPMRTIVRTPDKFAPTLSLNLTRS